MSFRIAHLALMVLSLAGGAQAATEDWLLGLKDRSTNDFIQDKRARPLIKRVLQRELATAVIQSLGGPPDPVYVEGGRYFSASGCMAHSCSNKGFFWMDVVAGTALGAAVDLAPAAQAGPAGDEADVLLLGSSRLDAASLPAEARRALQRFLDRNDLHPVLVTYVGKAADRQKLEPAQYTARPRFEPPEGGPGFDCRAANAGIEKAICASPALSKQDLELSTSYREQLKGYDRLWMVRQLQALQRAWVLKRNQACAPAAGQEACLATAYREQQDALLHWTPAFPKSAP